MFVTLVALYHVVCSWSQHCRGINSMHEMARVTVGQSSDERELISNEIRHMASCIFPYSQTASSALQVCVNCVFIITDKCISPPPPVNVIYKL